MKIIFQKKNFWWLYLVLDHQKKKKFYARIHNKYNKILEDLVFDNKKPGCTSQHIQEKIKLWNKN